MSLGSCSCQCLEAVFRWISRGVPPTHPASEIPGDGMDTEKTHGHFVNFPRFHARFHA